MGITYRGSGVTPAPFVSIAKTYQRSSDNEILYPTYEIQLQGSIVSTGKDIDTEHVTPYGGEMRGILGAQAYLKELFSVDGEELTISAPGGNERRLVLYPRINAINFDPGTWVNVNSYNISMTATASGEVPDNSVSSIEESWDISESIDGLFTISHRLSATGADYFDYTGEADSLSAAKNWCQERTYNIIGGTLLPTAQYDSVDLSEIISPINNSTSGNYYNYSIVESPNPGGNSWGVTETWIWSSGGNVREQWEASMTYEDVDYRRISISLNGNIHGYADDNRDLVTRNTRAKDFYYATAEPNAYTRLIGYIPDGYTLSPIASSRQISFQNNDGIVGYGLTFVAMTGNLIENSIEEDITIEDTGQNDIFATIPVPGRSLGPVVQNMKTVTLPERTINISAVMQPYAGVMNADNILTMYLDKPDVSSLISSLKPNKGYYYITSNTESWQPLKRQYSRQISWTISPTGSTLPDGTPPNSPNNEE